MYRNPILIRNIKHLTDARYFAAMGVDWISMPLTHNPESFATWHALADWIEGVNLAAEVDTDDEMLLAKTIIDAKPAGIVSHKRIPDQIAPDATLFLEVANMSELTDAGQVKYLLPFSTFHAADMPGTLDQSRIFLVDDWTPEVLREVLSSGFTGGICFQGGEEDEVGIRDFEQMDELLETLQVNR